jgi:hypothetical protein
MVGKIHLHMICMHITHVYTCMCVLKFIIGLAQLKESSETKTRMKTGILGGKQA